MKDQRPQVLVVAGSDSSALAGIQRDNQTILALGAHPINVITANTSQNQQGVQGVHPVNDLVFTEQFNIGLQRDIRAIKVGLLASIEQIQTLCASLQTSNFIPLILDPVMRASSGGELTNSTTFEMLQALRQLLPFCTLVTPNIEEAQALCDMDIEDRDDVMRAAHKLLAMGASNVLIKGGHFFEDATAVKVRDFFCNKHKAFWLLSPRLTASNSRGTGCAIASAIAAALALNYSLEDAVVIGKMAINEGLEQAYALSDQSGPVNISHFPEKQDYLPELVKPNNAELQNIHFPAPTRPNDDSTFLGLYPVVENADWIERLAAIGVTTLQLRVKTLEGDALVKEIQRAIDIAEHYQIRLFINDYWQLAIELGAYGVHLGQEDLDEADIKAIHAAGLRLGISTHCHYEVARAHACHPSYIACGPIYHTDSKQMPWIPHGPKGLAYWRKVLNYPLVAIGGINQARLQEIIQQDVDGVAMITAITLADDPESTTKTLLQQIQTSHSA